MKKKKVSLVWILGALTLVGAAGWVGIEFKSKDSQPQYRSVPVVRGDLELTVLATGVVQPENRVDIKPPIPGRAERVLVEEGNYVKAGQVLAWMSSTERAALLDAARAHGPEELKKWEDLYNPTPILAPINGTIILRSVEPGQTFTSTDSVLAMSDHLTVQAKVDETDISQIQLHQKARIILDAYPKSPIEAKVEKISFDAKTVNNVTTYQVSALPAVVPKFMRSGMTANVSFLVNSKAGILLVPTDSIKLHDGKAWVLVPAPKKDDPALEREVELGLTDGKKTEILKGVNEGTQILQTQFKIGTKSSSGSSPFSPIGTPKKGMGH